MVKKLFKHEFLAYARVMAIVYGILLTIATATRIILIFESDTTAYQIISTFSLIIYLVSAVAAALFSTAFGVIRFYKNLFTSEGYLSFTLPVTPSQHITVKAVTAVCVELLSLLVVLLSGCIVTSGEVLVEIWKALIYIWNQLYAQMGFHLVLAGGECLILFLVTSAASFMLYYTCISIGQLSKKNRILAAVGVYFAYYILAQIVSTVVTILISVVATTGAFEEIFFWVFQHPFASMHLGFWGFILLTSAFVVVEFLIIRAITTKKLNLE